jgi:predicted CoA-binding protein
MSSKPEEVLKNSRVFAVIGATRNKAKYGYEIFRILTDYGYKAYAVNPNYDSIEGFPCFPSLAELPEKPDVVVAVVPPDVTETIIDEAHRLGVPTIWMPPGSGSEAAVRKCEACRLGHVDETCVIFAVKSLGWRPAGR